MAGIAADSLGWTGRLALKLSNLTAANYLAWLGWDQTGSYQPWQIAGLATLAALVAVGTLIGVTLVASFVTLAEQRRELRS
jgi:Na+/melibiose symporter-like transporter